MMMTSLDGTVRHYSTTGNKSRTISPLAKIFSQQRRLLASWYGIAQLKIEIDDDPATPPVSTSVLTVCYY